MAKKPSLKQSLQIVSYTKSAEITQMETAIHVIISNEREVKTSEILLIQQLSALMILHHICLDDILTQGFQIHGENRDGPVVKENPSARNYMAIIPKIQKLFQMLGIEDLAGTKLKLLKGIEVDDGEESLRDILKDM